MFIHRPPLPEAQNSARSWSLLPLLRWTALMLFALAATFSHAASESEKGWRLSAVGGFGALADTDLKGTAGIAGDADFDVGFLAGAALDYERGPWRIGAEYLYQTNDTDSFDGRALPQGADEGDFSAVALSLNLSRQFNLLRSDRAVSYLGAGLVWLQEVDIDFETAAGERSFSTDSAGYQLFAGVRYRLAPQWQLGVELRYLDAGTLRLDSEGAASGTVTADYQRTSLLGSLSYRF